MKRLYTIIAFTFVMMNVEAQWVQVNNGIPSYSDITSFAVNGQDIFAGTEGGVYYSYDYGNNWHTINTGLTNYIIGSLAISGNNMFATTGGGVFLYNGGVWHAVNTDASIGLLVTSGTNLFAAGHDTLFLSTNNGSSWSVLNTAGFTTYSITGLGLNGTEILAGINHGVLLSTDNGTSWTEESTGFTYTFVESFAVSDTNIFAGTGTDGIFLSTNNCNSWTAVNTGLPTSYNISALAVSGTNIFAATWGGGVFLSTNNGNSWSAVNTGLTGHQVQALAICGTYIYAGTFDYGIYRRSIAEMTGISELQEETNITIAPNPFTSETTITFQEDARYIIKVTDLLGNTTVQSTINSKQYTLDMSGESKGIYFVQLTDEKKNVINKKLVLN